MEQFLTIENKPILVNDIHLKDQPKGKIAIIETIRGWAALSVCLYHFRLSNITFLGSSKWYEEVAKYGWLGVEAFFVVSGFIIPYALANSNYKSSMFFRFLAKRCLRLEPAYIVSIIFVVILGYFASLSPIFSGSYDPSFVNIILHIGYLPEHFGYKWLLPVYWTLEAEFHFYILIGLFFSLLWKNSLGFNIFVLVALVLTFIIPLKVFTYMPFFIFGMSSCAYRLKKINKLNFFLIIVSLLIVCFFKTHLLMALVAAFTMLLINFSNFSNSISAWLGKISFSLYLVHIPVGSKIVNLLGRYSSNEFHVWMIILIAIAASIAAAYIFYRLIEYPSIKWSKRISYRSA